VAKRQSLPHVIGEHVNEIRQLSSDCPIDEIELIRDGHRIVVNAYSRQMSPGTLWKPTPRIGSSV